MRVRALIAVLAGLVACSPPPPADDDDDATTPPADDELVELVPLASPERVPGLPLFFHPSEVGVNPGLDHITRLAWDPDDRWLDDFTGGFAALDCDVDGDVDLVFTSGDGEHTLFTNDGTARFTAKADAGIAFPGDPTGSASVADFDNDGDPDLLLLVQFGPNHLLVNDGACRFEDRAEELGLHDEYRSLHATWFDFDSDGWLDLYLTNWGGARGDDEPEQPPEPHPDRFWLSDQGEGFVDITDQLPPDTTEAFGMATAFFDVDDDGDYDLFQTNDRGGYFVPNRLFINEGQGDDGRWTFRDETDARGFTSSPDGMGLTFGDVDGDGDADIFAAGNFESLFINDGDGYFYEAGAANGLNDTTPTTLSWGGSFFDPDADGDIDLLYVESLFWDYGPDDPEQYNGPTWYFQNDFDTGDGFRSLPMMEGPFSVEANWRSEGTIDLNGDGYEDVVTSVVEENPRIALTNPTTGRGVVQVRLHGTLSNRDGRGAIVRLQTDRGEQVRWPGVIDVYSTGAPPWSTFGLGTATEAGPLVVQWPSGVVQEVASVPVGHVVHVTEPESR